LSLGLAIASRFVSDKATIGKVERSGQKDAGGRQQIREERYLFLRNAMRRISLFCSRRGRLSGYS
jgi:hypothetical protein